MREVWTKYELSQQDTHMHMDRYTSTGPAIGRVSLDRPNRHKRVYS